VHVTKAVLRLYQVLTNPIDPFGGSNSILLDHLANISQIDFSLYDATPLAANIGTLSTDPLQEVKELDVTQAVRDDLFAGRAAFEFRGRFAFEPAAGYVQYTGPAEINPPELVITYRTP
jgi:hypothetical protein